MDVPIVVTPNGTTRALNQVTIRARVKGFLKEVLFIEGADVKTGQLLLVIDEEPFQVKLALAKAKQAEAEAAQKKAEQSKMREIAQAQLALDQAVLLLAQVEEARQRALVARSAASRQDVDQAEANRKKSEAQVEADRASLEQARADFETDIQAAQANVAMAQSEVKNAEIELGYCRMSAPIDGRIGEALVQAGNLVGLTDDTPLATIEQLDPMGVDIMAPSRYLSEASAVIRDGMTVRLIVQGERPYPHAGKAFFIDNKVDPTTSTFLIKATVPNPEKTLLPGDYARIESVIGEFHDAIVVPEQAVLESQAGPIVWVVDPTKKVRIVPVLPLDTYRGLRVLEKGLEPGQEVIVEGIQLVRPGMEVKTEAALETLTRPEVQPGTGRRGRFESPLTKFGSPGPVPDATPEEKPAPAKSDVPR